MVLCGGGKHKNGKKMMRLMQQEEFCPLTDAKPAVQGMNALPPERGLA